jgi:hypothetical protein
MFGSAAPYRFYSFGFVVPSQIARKSGKLEPKNPISYDMINILTRARRSIPVSRRTRVESFGPLSSHSKYIDLIVHGVLGANPGANVGFEIVIRSSRTPHRWMARVHVRPLLTIASQLPCRLSRPALSHIRGIRFTTHMPRIRLASRRWGTYPRPRSYAIHSCCCV